MSPGKKEAKSEILAILMCDGVRDRRLSWKRTQCSRQLLEYINTPDFPEPAGPLSQHMRRPFSSRAHAFIFCNTSVRVPSLHMDASSCSRSKESYAACWLMWFFNKSNKDARNRRLGWESRELDIASHLREGALTFVIVFLDKKSPFTLPM